MSTTTPGTAPLPRLSYTIEEAASALGIGRTKMYDLILNGSLRTVKIGRRRVVPVDALHDFLSTEGHGAVKAAPSQP